ncbi:hypothetical protein K0U83_26370 [bacterium]|nr:hypothetical protein [bacterium]
MTSAYDPIPVTILAIDPGRTSGWAVFAFDRCIASGTATTHDQRVLAIEIAQAEESRSGRKLIVVAEKWAPGGRWYTATMTGIGAAWGMWQAALESCGVPAARIVRVYPQTWRAKVLGGGWGVKSDEWALRAAKRAETETGHPCSDDEAEAVCVGAWALRAEAVRDKAPSRRRKLVTPR